MGNRLGSEPRPSLPDAYSPIKLPEKLTTMLPVCHLKFSVLKGYFDYISI